ncbi:MAG: GGDEF domain-containing protein [Ktedonobacteraceae bacterium]|nr:GGDEF domain-containing protein [Ktedonobacteraceae bacterium]
MSIHSAQQMNRPDENGLAGEPGERTMAYRELLEQYTREAKAHEHLQRTYNEMQIMVQHQQKMFTVVKQLYNEQVQAASTDAMTGLPNYRAVMDRIEEEIAQCEGEISLTMLFIDIDHFKQVNDTYGHRAGDAVLLEVGTRLRTGIRAGDFVGRYGGEEFAIVLSGYNIEDASRICERLRASIADTPCTYEVEETQTIITIPVTASFGVASFRLHGLSRNALIESADQAMYMAKHTGRNRICRAEIPLLARSEES